jgi:hypothetical protein
MATNDYNQVAFHVGGAKKDVNHIIQLGEDHGLDLQVSKVMRGNMEELEKMKGDKIDVTGIVGGMYTGVIIYFWNSYTMNNHVSHQTLNL